MGSWTEQDLQRLLSDRGKARQDAATPKPSKYRNVKVVIDGERFDSKREAAYWSELKLREKAGEISGVLRQVAYPLYAPSHESTACVEVATYIADFAFFDHEGTRHLQDVKGGKETAMFTLKRKWLYLQSGIEIEVVR